MIFFRFFDNAFVIFRKKYDFYSLGKITSQNIQAVFFNLFQVAEP